MMSGSLEKLGYVNKSPRLWIAVTACLVVVQAVYHATARTLYNDELQTLRIMLGEVARTPEQGPLYYELLSLWTRILGRGDLIHDDLMLRSLSIVFMVIALVRFPSLLKVLHIPAHWPMLLLASAPALIVTSYNARPYALYLLIGQELLIAAVKGKDGHRWALVRFPVLVWLGVQTHAYTLIVGGVLGFWIGIRGLMALGRKGSGWNVAGGRIASGLVTGFLVLEFFRQMNRGRDFAENVVREEMHQPLWAFMGTVASYFAGGSGGILTGLSVVAWAMVLGAAVWARREVGFVGLVLCISLLGALYYGWQDGVHRLLVRYTLPIVAMQYAGLCLGLAAWQENLSKQRRFPIIGVVLLPILVANGAGNYRINVTGGEHENWVHVMESVAAISQSDDAIWFLPDFMSIAARQYGTVDIASRLRPIPETKSNILLQQAVSAQSPQAITMMFAGNDTGLYWGLQDANWTLTHAAIHGGVAVWRFDKATALPPAMLAKRPPKSTLTSVMPIFEWQEVPNADHYAFIVAAPGRIPFYYRTEERLLDLESLFGARLELLLDGEFRWQVAALNAHAEVIAITPSMSFVLRRQE